MIKNNYIKAFCLLCVTVLLLSGCGSSAPETLYQSENIQVIRSGNKTAVLDLVSDNEYNYITKLTKRTKAVTEPYTTVDTDTVKIEIIPHGLRVYDKEENTIFTVKRNLLRKKGGEFMELKPKDEQILTALLSHGTIAEAARVQESANP